MPHPVSTAAPRAPPRAAGSTPPVGGCCRRSSPNYSPRDNSATFIPAQSGEVRADEPVIDVVIGGLKAEVSFAGLGPGYIGVFAVTATVPSAVQPSDDVPVQLRVHLPDGRVSTSNYVTIAVAAGAN